MLGPPKSKEYVGAPNVEFPQQTKLCEALCTHRAKKSTIGRYRANLDAPCLVESLDLLLDFDKSPAC